MTAVNPSWIDGVSLDSFRLRRIDSLMVMPNGLDPLGARSGILPGSNGFNVTVSGTTITVGTGIGSLYFAGQGIYRIAMTSTSNLTLNAPHATLPRIDLVYLRVWDNNIDGSGQTTADVVYLAGTASSTPSAPTPSGTVIYMRLAHITVPASGGGSPTVNTTVRPITVASGGILPSSTAPAGPYVGQYYDDGTNLFRYNGTDWDTYQKVPGAWTPFTPAWTGSTTNPSIGNGTLTGRYSKMGRTVMCEIFMIPGSTTTFGSGTYLLSVPFAKSSATEAVGAARLTAGSVFLGHCILGSGATTMNVSFPNQSINGLGQNWGNTVPATFANGHTLRMSITYEAAS
ncbi:hypothetical protein [Streptomyces sp. NPDC004230]